MEILRDEIMIIGIPPRCHKQLSRWAAERNERSPGTKVTAETIAAEAICEYIDRAERMELALSPEGDREEGKEKSQP